jgi:glutathione S-transferase
LDKSYKLYGSEFSLFTGKLRSYLRKKGIAYEEVLSTVGVYKKFIVPRTGVRYVPVLQTPEDTVLQDTTVIIDELEKRFVENSVYPDSPKQKMVALLLELYGDEWLVIPAMHYRWNFPATNDRFIYGEFGSLVAPKAPGFIRRWLGAKIGAKFKGFVPAIGITSGTINAIETSYVGFLKDLNAHLENHDYLLGDRPCIADFGFMGPLYAHLYRDPAPRKLMRKVAPAVCAWILRMNSDAATMTDNDLLPNDEIPATLIPILQRMASEQAPVLVDTNRLLDEWREQNPDAEEIPRSIGKHEFTIGDATGERIVIPYALWMLQRSVDFYQSLEDTQAVDALLAEVGLHSLIKNGLSNRIQRPNNKTTFA